MTHHAVVAVRGDPASALETVRSVLVHLNFRVTPIGPSEFQAAGPGMSHSFAHPLLGIAEARVSLLGRDLSLEADLGALRRFGRWLGLFLGGMAIFMLALFVFLSSQGWLYGRGGSRPVEGATLVGVILLPFAPWLVILPLVLRSLRRKTVRAIDTLLANAADRV
jgi:hypothetical protein